MRDDEHSRILIVDDDLDARETMGYVLARSGYAVSLAADGRQALELLRSETPYCLILLDLRMPVMDGWAFLSALERDPALASIPIVVVSARADGVSPSRVKGVLTKPIDTRVLIETVRDHCAEAAGKEQRP